MGFISCYTIPITIILEKIKSIIIIITISNSNSNNDTFSLIPIATIYFYYKTKKDKFAVEMREVNEKLDQASIQIRTFEEEVLCYKEKANTLQNENNQLVIQKDALENAVLENEKLNMALHNEKLKMLQELKEQSKDIEEKNRMIQIIEGLNISITYKTTKLETRCKTKENELNSLQLENKQLAIQKDALENEKQEIKTEYISLKNYAVKLETHYKEQKDKFAVEMREVNEKLDQASIQIRTFEEEVLCYKEKANTLHNENKKLKADKFRYFLRLILLSGKPDGSLDCDPKEKSQLQDYEASSDSIYFTPQKFDDSNL